MDAKRAIVIMQYEHMVANHIGRSGHAVTSVIGAPSPCGSGIGLFAQNVFDLAAACHGRTWY
ncbi:hypothetical protein [Bifidobacterium stellenboschense]|uniref:hypothetical protein n=1 Tax=Bifidobacterium stellenboschense TaxID=762211 RepID=UPI0005565AA3|nr:hypothetical protein [Bifidobacterium stellenboschense]